MKRYTGSNLFSVETYCRLLPLLQLAMGLFFVKRIAFYRVFGLRLVKLILTVLIVSILHLLFTVRKERNIFSLFTGAVLPFALYEVCSLAALPAVRTMLHTSLARALLGGLLWTVVEVWIHSCCKRRFIARKLICGTALLLAILLVGCADRAHDLYVEAFSQLLEDMLIETVEAEEEITENEELTTVLTAFSAPSDWEKLSRESKEGMYTALLKAECAALGMQTEPTLVFEYLPTNDVKITLGTYNRIEDKITISKAMLNAYDPFKCAETLLHELRHRYQHHITDLYRQVLKACPDYRNLSMWDDAKAFLRPYIDLKEATEEAYAAYLSQPTEVDARAYAEERVGFYREMLSKVCDE